MGDGATRRRLLPSPPPGPATGAMLGTRTTWRIDVASTAPMTARTGGASWCWPAVRGRGGRGGRRRLGAEPDGPTRGRPTGVTVAVAPPRRPGQPAGPPPIAPPAAAHPRRPARPRRAAPRCRARHHHHRPPGPASAPAGRDHPRRHRPGTRSLARHRACRGSWATWSWPATAPRSPSRSATSSSSSPVTRSRSTSAGRPSPTPPAGLVIVAGERGRHRRAERRPHRHPVRLPPAGPGHRAHRGQAAPARSRPASRSIPTRRCPRSTTAPRPAATSSRAQRRSP